MRISKFKVPPLSAFNSRQYVEIECNKCDLMFELGTNSYFCNSLNYDNNFICSPHPFYLQWHYQELVQLAFQCVSKDCVYL